MQRAYIISTGTELMLGTTVDTNAVFLSQHLTSLGFKVVGKSTVGDSAEYIREAFNQGLRLSDLVISSGGMGPTLDDLTKEVACQAMGVDLILREEEAQNLREFFQRRRREMPEANLKQAMFPKEARTIRNAEGTAPGMYLKQNGKAVILLPGPPREMETMFTSEVEPLLKEEFSTQEKVTRKTIKVLGPGESQVEAMLGNIMDQFNGLSLALLAWEGEVHVKISAEGADQEQSRRVIGEATAHIQKLLGDHIFAYDEDTLGGSVACLLEERKLTVSVAESCTGGFLSKMLTDLPGSSQYFWGSVCSYSNESKKKFLSLSHDTLERFGAVSSETAAEMAEKLRLYCGTDYSLSITGIAGPHGGSAEKPVGLVYIGMAAAETSQVKELRFVGSRDAIRILAAKSALDLLRRHMLGGGNT